MYKKHYYLYIAPIKGEENSVERQLESGKDFIRTCFCDKYKAIVTESEEEMYKPITVREGFNGFRYNFGDSYDRLILVMDIGLLNGMDFWEFTELGNHFQFLDIILISDGSFVANYGLQYPSAITKITLEDEKNTNIESHYRNFSNVAAYRCPPEKRKGKGFSDYVLLEFYSTMVTGTRNIHIYDEVDIYNTSSVNERINLKTMLEKIKNGSYDIALTFVEAFRADELDSVISEIRKYVPVILVDEDEKFDFLDVLKN